MQSPLRRFGHYEVFVIVLHVPVCLPAAFKFILQTGQIPGKAQPLIGTALVVEVYMDIDSPLVTYTFPRPWLLFPIVPFISEAHGIQPHIIVVIFPADHLLSTNLVQMLSCNF